MENFSQISADISQMSDFFVNQALTTAQQVQSGVTRIQTPQQQVVQNTSGTSSGGLFWFGIGSLATLVVAYYLWRKGQ